MPKFTLVLGARCYDTYSIECASLKEAVDRVLAQDFTDDGVIEENLGEVASQEYHIEDVVSIHRDGKDVSHLFDSEMSNRLAFSLVCQALDRLVAASREPGAGEEATARLQEALLTIDGILALIEAEGAA